MKQKRLIAVVIAAGLAATSGVALSDGRGRGNTVHAQLEGFQEVPAVSSPGSGSFRAKIDRRAQTIDYVLDYEGTQGKVFMAHIHVGQHHVNGGISVWLCGNSEDVATGTVIPPNTPRCPVPNGEVRGTLTASAVVGPAAQLIAVGQMEELIVAIREGVTYVNVHTTLASGGVPGGEIRGQIR